MRGITGYPRPRSRPVLRTAGPPEPPPAPPAPPTFVRLSALLTGFSEYDLLGTGVADLQWRALLHGAGSVAAADLLAAFEVAERAGVADLEDAVRVSVMEDARLGPVARSVVKAWYTGTWVALPADWLGEYAPELTPQPTRVIAPETYVESLAWVAAGTHPAGAKAPGYGSWSRPPDAVAGAS